MKPGRRIPDNAVDLHYESAALTAELRALKVLSPSLEKAAQWRNLIRRQPQAAVGEYHRQVAAMFDTSEIGLFK